MNLNEHLKRLENKTRLRKGIIVVFGITLIIVGVIRFNDIIEREEIDRNNNRETLKLFEKYRNRKDSLQRDKTIVKRLKKLDSISQVEEKKRQEMNTRIDNSIKEVKEKFKKNMD